LWLRCLPSDRHAQTVVDSATIRRILKEVAAEGVAFEEDQTDLGVACIAAPVFDNEEVVAVISLSAPTVRMTKSALSKWKTLLREGAHTISLRLQGSIK